MRTAKKEALARLLKTINYWLASDFDTEIKIEHKNDRYYSFDMPKEDNDDEYRLFEYGSAPIAPPDGQFVAVSGQKDGPYLPRVSSGKVTEEDKLTCYRQHSGDLAEINGTVDWPHWYLLKKDEGEVTTKKLVTEIEAKE